MSTENVKIIPLDKIVVSENAMRTLDRESEQYQGIIASIKEKGFFSAVTVRRTHDPVTGHEVYQLIDGLQRTSAAREAGLTEVSAVIMDMNDAEAMEAQLMANVHRVETPACVYAAHLRRMMMMNPTLTVPVLADKISMSPAWISQRLSLVKIDPTIQPLVNEGRINISNAYALAKLPAEDQKELLDVAVAQAPSEFIPMATERARSIREKHRQGEAAAPIVFTPTPYAQKLKDLKQEYETRKMSQELVTLYKPKTLTDAFNLAIDWVLHLDPQSITLQKAKFDEREGLKEEKRKRSLAAREEKIRIQREALEKEAQVLATLKK